jgi:hypothetical protein
MGSQLLAVGDRCRMPGDECPKDADCDNSAHSSAGIALAFLTIGSRQRNVAAIDIQPVELDFYLGRLPKGPLPVR